MLEVLRLRHLKFSVTFGLDHFRMPIEGQWSGGKGVGALLHGKILVRKRPSFGT